MKKSIKIVIGLVVAGGLVAGGIFFYNNLLVHLPEYEQQPKAVWLEQGWKSDEREWYHHADQGTQSFNVPLEWFLKLEQPRPAIGATGLLSDPVYLDRLGFIPGTAPDGLPVGIASGGVMMETASGQPWLNPQTQKPMTRVGFTCAACHTGRMTYKGTAILIDGGPALTDVGTFRTALGLSVFYTKFWPGRFDRFEENVLGKDASDEAKAAFKTQFDAAFDVFNLIRKSDARTKDGTVTEGYGRLDALNRIGNQVFSLDLGQPDNYAPTSAPVHYPRIWNAPWFDWVQYNGSIMQPMVRNAGEALGVGVWLNLTDTKQLYVSTVEIESLFKIEQMLAGQQPDESHGFSGLTSPKWPDDIFGPINADLAKKGEGLYAELCRGCHLAPVNTPEFWQSKRWTPPDEFGRRHLLAKLFTLEDIGTDPAQAQDMKDRKVTVPKGLGLQPDEPGPALEFGPALGDLVEKAVIQWYDSQTPPTPDDLRTEMNGFRKNGIQAPLAYKVRPLNGIWATPPYLHNGSVPTLYDLLSPANERPTTFHLGNREYDPKKVGYMPDEIDNDFEFDTSKRGNFNTGHEFNDGPETEGRVGRKLSPDERMALIEFLKTL